MNKMTKTSKNITLPGFLATKTDFSVFDDVIIRLENSSGILSDKEKELATKAIKDWQDLVVEHIQSNVTAAQEYLQTLQGNSINEEILLELARNAGLTSLIEKYKEILDEIAIHQTKKPDNPEVATTDSVAESLAKEYDYQCDMAIYTRRYQQLIAQKSNLQAAIRRELLKNDSVKELRDKLTSYRRDISRTLSKCKEKAQLAAISISIGNKDVRRALKNMVAFTSQL